MRGPGLWYEGARADSQLDMLSVMTSSDTTLHPYLCIIGAGSGGLSVAAAAAQLGVDTVLIERGRMGGDCLNYGCVPSKSLIAAAHAANAARHADRFGIAAGAPSADFARVRDHVQGVIADIAPHDSQERFEGLGATVLRETAAFTGRDQVQAGPIRIRAKRFVIATGSSPIAPPVPGLDQVPYFTNETIFDNDVRPEHLLVLGGGPIGCELAQAHRRLGCEVTVVQRGRLLHRDDPDLAQVVARRFQEEGIAVIEGAAVTSAAGTDGGIRLTVQDAEGTRDVTGTHLLVAAGRRANVEDLNLDAAGIRCNRKGIEVDDGLRTSNRRVYAIGDVIGRLQFTHIAGYHAGIVVRRALFRLPARVNEAAAPWVTYTDPEIAQVGLNEPTARERFGDRVRVVEMPVGGNDRFRAERETEGLIKVIVHRGRVVGASMVGVHAGELIQPWCLMATHRMKIGQMTSAILPYPTRGEINKQVAGSYFTPALFGPRTRKIVGLLTRLG